jgi:hypothetical protein
MPQQEPSRLEQTKRRDELAKQVRAELLSADQERAGALEKAIQTVLKECGQGSKVGSASTSQ